MKSYIYGSWRSSNKVSIKKFSKGSVAKAVREK